MLEDTLDQPEEVLECDDDWIDNWGVEEDDIFDEDIFDDAFDDDDLTHEEELDQLHAALDHAELGRRKENYEL